MKKQYILMFAVMTLLILSVASVSAFMPRFTHKYIFQKGIDAPVDNELYKACLAHPSLCYSGNVLVDVSVIWYWTEGTKYDVTHSPNFCRNLIESSVTEQEYACAVGGCTHLPADITSHNEVVPTAIKNSLLVNYIIHVFAEQKIDNWVERNYPEVGTEAIAYLSDYEQCTPLFKRVMLGYAEYDDLNSEDIDDTFDKFVTEIMTSQTGYDTAFKQKSFMVNFKALPFSIIFIFTTVMLAFLLLFILILIKIIKGNTKFRYWFGLILFGLLLFVFAYIFIANLQGRAFNAIINVAKPISGLVPIGNTPEYYLNEGIVNTKSFFQTGQTYLQGTEPSGFTVMKAADRRVLLLDYIIMAVLIFALILYIYFLFKANPNSPKKTKQAYNSSSFGSDMPF